MSNPKNWEVRNQGLTRTFECEGFTEITVLLMELAKWCDQYPHHPEVRMHGYRHVTFSLITHDAGDSLTEKDHALAQEIDRLFEK